MLQRFKIMKQDGFKMCFYVLKPNGIEIKLQNLLAAAFHASKQYIGIDFWNTAWYIDLTWN